MEKHVEILMATYNGEKYLSAQIESILKQTHTNWTLIVRDDGSNDNSINLLRQFSEKDNRIRIVNDKKGNMGQCLNFRELISYVSADSYVMFADQDDVWFEDKIEVSLDYLMTFENKQNEKILLYTNYFNYQDSTGQKSIAYENTMEFRNVPENIIVQNWLMGCTMLLTPAMVSIGKDIPIEADNHDNWYAIIASLCGHIVYYHTPTMLHRVHSNNVTYREETKKLKNRVQRTIKSFHNKEAYIKNKKTLSLEIEKVINKHGTSEGKDIFKTYKKIIFEKGIKSIFEAKRNNFKAFNRVQTLIFYASLY
ncbi:glycosyltransferase [Vagococcus elongatus]|uniref:Glycosyltransferase 2-like domain-containing protein n=1 Tax=Vagococcus elongatus TaxID=180344 RepID=A0A430B497_9ENTE|nr:glycosyltransferase [Vagococcus elongatus]RSU15061.1 hypothetical protein CBF29_01610 [Vagococcus elongatus]